MELKRKRMSVLAPAAFVYLLSTLYAHVMLPLTVATIWAKLWLVSNAVVSAACIAAGSGVKLDKELLRAQDICLWFHEASAVTFLAAAFLLRFGSYFSGLAFVALGLAICAQKTPLRQWHKAFEAIPELNLNAQFVAATSALAITAVSFSNGNVAGMLAGLTLVLAYDILAFGKKLEGLSPLDMSLMLFAASNFFVAAAL